jgi:hypothetical protein
MKVAPPVRIRAQPPPSKYLDRRRRAAPIGRILVMRLFTATFVLAAVFLLVFSVKAAGLEQPFLRSKTGTLTTGFGDVQYQPTNKVERRASYPSDLEFGDAVRTLRSARAHVEFKDRSFLNMPDRSRLLIVPSDRATNGVAIRVTDGQAYYLHHGAPRSIVFETPTPNLALVPRGTEFLVSVDKAANQTFIAMFDGEVEMARGDEPKLIVQSGQFGVAEAGQPLRVGSLLEATNIVQWWIYYPGVLDPSDLHLEAEAAKNLDASLAAYRQGDLRAALEKHPGLAQPPRQVSPDERAYYAALLLANGSVADALVELRSLPDDFPLTRALRTVIDAVSTPLPGQVSNASGSATPPLALPYDSSRLASEWLAFSYQQQSEHDLDGALHSARSAVERK